MLKRGAGIDLLHVPYRSYAHALPDLVAGRIAVAMADLTVFGGALQAGEARALAVAAPDRSPFLPDVPTMAEEGFPGFDASVWFGMFAPARTPTETVARLNAEDWKERDGAESQLTEMGPIVAPVLKSMREAQPPEAQQRIDKVLAAVAGPKGKKPATPAPVPVE